MTSIEISMLNSASHTPLSYCVRVSVGLGVAVTLVSEMCPGFPDQSLFSGRESVRSEPTSAV